MKADIYAFGCMMFEMLTGKALFSGGDELALVGRHVSHDGWLPELAKMARVPSLERIAKLLGSTLRHDGRNRPDAVELRAEITPALMPLTDAEWPLKLSAIA
jgi:serine/threonine-protein kinase